MSAFPRLSTLRCVRCGRRLSGALACVIAFPAASTDRLLAWDCVEHARLDGWPWLASEPGPRLSPRQENAR